MKVHKKIKVAAAVIVLSRAEHGKLQKKRIWSRSWLLKRDALSHANLIARIRHVPDDFRNYLRMSEDVFEKLLSLVP